MAENWARNKKKRQQRDYFVRQNGEILADYIMPYDALENHFETITKALQIDAKLPRKNVSKVKKLEEPLADGLLEEIREHFSEDYALFDQISDINARGLERLKATRSQTPPIPA